MKSLMCGRKKSKVKSTLIFFDTVLWDDDVGRGFVEGLSCNTPHRRSTTVSLESYALYSVQIVLPFC